MSTFTEHLTLGERLARARTFADLSQTELADKLGITRKSVFNYETDHRTPGFELVCDWARITRVPLSYFADGTLDDGESAANSWYMTQNGRSGAHYLRPVADVIDLTRPFPHHVPVECDGQVALPLPDSCPVNQSSEHHGLTPAA